MYRAHYTDPETGEISLINIGEYDESVHKGHLTCADSCCEAPIYYQPEVFVDGIKTKRLAVFASKPTTLQYNAEKKKNTRVAVHHPSCRYQMPPQNSNSPLSLDEALSGNKEILISLNVEGLRKPTESFHYAASKKKPDYCRKSVRDTKDLIKYLALIQDKGGLDAMNNQVKIIFNGIKIQLKDFILDNKGHGQSDDVHGHFVHSILNDAQNMRAYGKIYGPLGHFTSNGNFVGRPMLMRFRPTKEEAAAVRPTGSPQMNFDFVTRDDDGNPKKTSPVVKGNGVCIASSETSSIIKTDRLLCHSLSPHSRDHIAGSDSVWVVARPVVKIDDLNKAMDLFEKGLSAKKHITILWRLDGPHAFADATPDKIAANQAHERKANAQRKHELT